MQKDTKACVDESVAFLRTKTRGVPKVGLVLGSGLGPFGDTLSDRIKIGYSDIPHFMASNVPGHAGNLCFGTVENVAVVCMQGRVHSYEGHSVDAVVHGVRTMARLGVSAVLITNAAGGLDPNWSPGDFMRITDHLNLTGQSPLTGKNDDSLGPRFPDMSFAYDKAIGDALSSVATKHGITLRQGVYAGLLGPSYETPAEIRMLQFLGASAVGMSTVLEVIALRHMGVKVGAFSCITNLGAGISRGELNHKEVEETAQAKREVALALLQGWTVATGALA